MLCDQLQLVGTKGNSIGIQLKNQFYQSLLANLSKNLDTLVDHQTEI